MKTCQEDFLKSLVNLRDYFHVNLCERSRHAGDAVGVTLRSLTSAGVRVNTCVPFVSVIYRRTEIHRGVVYG